MEHFLLVLCVILCIISIVGMYICANKKLYCKFYLRNEWDLWELICLNLDKAVFVEHYEYERLPDIENYKYHLKIDDEIYELIYWAKEGYTSVHKDGDCVLCHFDTYHTNIVSNWIRENISRDISPLSDKESKV